MIKILNDVQKIECASGETLYYRALNTETGDEVYVDGSLKCFSVGEIVDENEATVFQSLEELKAL